MYNTEALRRLQEVDLEVARLVQQGEEKKKTPAQIEAQIQKLNALLARAKADLASKEKERRAIEAELPVLAEQQKKLEAKLQKAVDFKMAEAGQHELDALADKKDAIEEKILAAMEKEDEAKALAKKAEDGIAEFAKKLAREKTDLPAFLAQIEAKIQEKKGEREKWRGQVDKTDLARYDQLWGKVKGRAVVEVEKACAGCDSYFGPDELGLLMHATDKVHRCRNCGRLMIYVGATSL